jgi:hypothetical protein
LKACIYFNKSIALILHTTWGEMVYVGTTCLRAAGSSPASPTVWVFWRLIWRTESLDRGLILACRYSLGSAYQLRLRPALVYKVGCTCVTLYCSQMGKRLSQGNMRRLNDNSLRVSFIIFRFHKDNTLE